MIDLIEITIPELEPLAADPARLPVLGKSAAEHLETLFAGAADPVRWRCDFIPSPEFAARLAATADFIVADPESGVILASRGNAAAAKHFIPEGFRIRYPWDVLKVNETLVSALDADAVSGTVTPGAYIDGHIVLGENSRLLPGVVIEGNVVIGRGCKIGPNCYLRGSTVIGDHVHIGQAVEVKNSVIGSRSSIGHLSYVGDSVIGTGVNFGAGTIIGNLRHDGRNHRSMVHGALVETGRRKFGAIIGDGVHTGINTAIYPGRKLWPGVTTRPGEIVDRDKRE